MILNYIQTSATLLLLALSQPAQAQDPASLVRRIASTAQLAAQEYGLGVSGGRVVATAEVEEARLFLTEAARAAGQLPAPAGEEIRRELEAALALVNRTAAPDSVTAVVAALVAEMAARFSVTLDEIPEATPSLSRGAVLYHATCASCHGTLGRGDGKAAAGLNPAPANLADASALRDVTPLDFYRRTTIGVAGTAMPAFEVALSPEDRWAVAMYATTLRLPAATGGVPPALSAFATTARMSDAELLAALGPVATLASVAAVRTATGGTLVQDRHGVKAATTLSTVRRLVDSSLGLARAGQAEPARQAALDAYLAYEAVERDVRAKSSAVADDAEAAFAALRERGPGAVPSDLQQIEQNLRVALERSERALGEDLSPVNLFVQSLIILLREGLEAILIVGALLTFLVKTGAASRRRDIHVGVGAALVVSLLTALLIETIFHLTPARQELLEGLTMAAATAMLFYVSYWLLTKVEVNKWNAFVKGKVSEALTSGSALALASVAFLAVYREGFETVLFYKALFLSGGAGGWLPILSGMAAGALLLAAVYIALNRYGVRLPLKPFFAVTSAFLYYMAFVFAGKAVAELQGGGLVGTTPVDWAPRVPMLGIYPTVESLLAQGVLVALAVAALAWIFWIGPARGRRRVVARPASPEGVDRELMRSLERIDADLAEARAEVERVKERLTIGHL
jgi:high-affinity iron transporter